MRADVKLQPSSGSLQQLGSSLTAAISAALPENGSVGRVAVDCKIYFCQDENLCLFEEVVFRIPVSQQLAAEQTQDITLRHSLSPKASTVDFP